MKRICTYCGYRGGRRGAATGCAPSCGPWCMQQTRASHICGRGPSPRGGSCGHASGPSWQNWTHRSKKKKIEKLVKFYAHEDQQLLFEKCTWKAISLNTERGGLIQISFYIIFLSIDNIRMTQLNTERKVQQCSSFLEHRHGHCVWLD